MKAWIALAAALVLASAAEAGEKKAAMTYAPMQPFETIAGKSWRGEWQDPDGKHIVDHSRWDYILGGKAVQMTHRIENDPYGGTTIFFYDEGKKQYVFHYFTTGGFDTTGSATFENGEMVAVEKVNGHPEIAEVVSRTAFQPDEMRITVHYVGKDGEKAPDIFRIYKSEKKKPDLF